MDDTEALGRANEAYRVGKDWFDGNERQRLNESLALFYSEHPVGSRYNEPAYTKRSRIFRPKTRSMVEKHVSGAAVALFANSDVVNIRAEDASDKAAVEAAKLQHEVLNYRLAETMPWMETVLGAFTDVIVQGRCFSRQGWAFKNEGSEDPEHDTIGSVLVPREHLFWSPAADWINPVKGSIFLIERVPWVASELHERIEQSVAKPPAQLPDGSKEIGIEYLPVTLEQIMGTATDNTADTISAQREGGKRDRYTRVATGPQYFGICWVHRNIMRIRGEDWYYETLGERLLLSKPQLLKEVIGVSFRPYACGIGSIEPHRMDTTSVVHIGRGLQEELNDNANLRTDNLRLAINNRWLMRRGASTDLNSLLRNVAGSITMTTDPDRDVKPLITKAVDGASFADQDRLNLDFDDQAGVMTGSTVGSARNLNETVGGMNLLSNSAGQVAELRLRLFVVTWVQPVLRQLLAITQVFEDDANVLRLAADRAGMENADGAMGAMKAKTKLRVAVGFGETTPEKRIQKLSLGFGTIGQIVPQAIQQADPMEIIKEVMGALGYDDGERFFPALNGEEDPQTAELRQQVEQLTAMVEGKEMEFKNRLEVAQIGAQARMQTAKVTAEKDVMIAKLRSAIEKMKQDEENKRENMRVAMEREALSQNILMQERQLQLQSPQQGPMNLPGEDRAGIIGRDQYGQALDAPG